MAQYRKRSIVIEALQLTATNVNVIENFVGQKLRRYFNATIPDGENYDGLIIQTLEGAMLARIGDYIIKGVKGEFYPCKPDIFESTYEKI
jgi:hypothetical protein